jgi:hypothetical protein
MLDELEAAAERTTRRYVVERSYLVRRVETWVVETDRDLTDDGGMSWGEIDQYVCDHGEMTEETCDLVDNDELDYTVTERTAYNVANHVPSD